MSLMRAPLVEVCLCQRKYCTYCKKLNKNECKAGPCEILFISYQALKGSSIEWPHPLSIKLLCPKIPLSELLTFDLCSNTWFCHQSQEWSYFEIHISQPNNRPKSSIDSAIAELPYIQPQHNLPGITKLTGQEVSDADPQRNKK